MDILVNIAAFLVAIFILVAVHEYGHYITAMKVGITVEKFFVGFGPTVFSWIGKKNGVEYGIKAIPLGGFVSMAGEEPTDVSKVVITEENRGHYYLQPVWKRAAVAFAGPFFNLLLAIVLFIFVYAIGNKVIPPVIGYVAADSLAMTSGFKAGDRIVKVGDEAIHSWSELSLELTNHLGKETTFKLVGKDSSERDVVVNIPDTLDKDSIETNVPYEVFNMSFSDRVKVIGIGEDSPAKKAGLVVGDTIVQINGKDVRRIEDVIDAVGKTPNNNYLIRDSSKKNTKYIEITRDSETLMIGVEMMPAFSGEYETYRLNPIAAVGQGMVEAWKMTKLTVEGLWKMLSGAVSSENIGGPIAIADMAGQTASNGFTSFLFFLAIISVNLAVVNLFPLPILDGGLLVYYGLEAIRGKPVSIKFQEKAQMVGIFLLICLFAYSTFNDIMRYSF